MHAKRGKGGAHLQIKDASKTYTMLSSEKGEEAHIQEIML